MKNKISVSAIDTFADCPLKYKFQYVDRIYRPGNEHFTFGTIGHKVLEYITLGMDNETIFTMLDIEKEKSATQLALEKLKISDVDQLMKDYIKALREFLSNYHIIGSEIKIRDDENVGVIDLLAVEKNTKKLLILDYKFTNYEKTESDIEDNLQLYMYAKLLGSMQGIEDIINKYDITSVYLGYLSLSKKANKQPRLLKDGKLSTAMSSNVTYTTFKHAIDKHGLDENDYAEHLKKLKEKEKPLYSFVEKRLHKNEFEEKLNEIESWTKLIRYATENDLFPGRNAWNCSKCDIKKECKNHIGGKI